jgi:Holliday junction DNA helicase RuvA
MLDRLSGRIAGGGKDYAVVDCAGVGFRVSVPAETRTVMPGEGEEVVLFTHLHLREGSAEIFGFSTRAERELFLAMTGIAGVGPKTALSVLSVLGVNGVLAAASREDTVAFTRVPGIGKKLAQRIALELPDRLKKVSVEFAPSAGEEPHPPTAPETQAAEALAALGFSRAEAQLAVAAARREKGMDLPADALIREALRRLSGARG